MFIDRKHYFHYQRKDFPPIMLNDKTILITGGTGFFGKKCTEIILKKYKPKRLII